VTRLEKCGTMRGLVGCEFVLLGIAHPFAWWLAAIGASLVWWAFWAVAKLEKGEL
jgi:hypothetical protein